MNWWEVCISVADEDTAALFSALMEQLGAEGMWEEEGQLLAYFPANDRSQARLRDELRPIFAYGAHVGIHFIEDRNWNAPPQDIPYTAFQLLRFKDAALAANSGPLELELETESAFGDGHHPTTRTLITRMLKHAWPYNRVLDVGCGTGVLAILAARLGAGPVVAFDNDWRSVNHTQANAHRNHCPQIEVLEAAAPALPKGEFDVVLANISLRLLLEAMPVMGHRLPKGGLALLSGFMPSELPQLTAAAQASGFRQEWHRSESGWMTAEFYKTTE